jgi:hypothetical protein
METFLFLNLEIEIIFSKVSDAKANEKDANEFQIVLNLSRNV